MEDEEDLNGILLEEETQEGGGKGKKKAPKNKATKKKQTKKASKKKAAKKKGTAKKKKPTKKKPKKKPTKKKPKKKPTKKKPKKKPTKKKNKKKPSKKKKVQKNPPTTPDTSLIPQRNTGDSNNQSAENLSANAANAFTANRNTGDPNNLNANRNTGDPTDPNSNGNGTPNSEDPNSLNSNGNGTPNSKDPNSLNSNGNGTPNSKDPNSMTFAQKRAMFNKKKKRNNRPISTINNPRNPSIDNINMSNFQDPNGTPIFPPPKISKLNGLKLPGIIVEIPYKDYDGPSKSEFTEKIVGREIFKNDGVELRKAHFYAPAKDGTKYYEVYGNNEKDIANSIRIFRIWYEDNESPKQSFNKVINDILTKDQITLEELQVTRDKLIKNANSLNDPKEIETAARSIEFVKQKIENTEQAIGTGVELVK